METPAHSIAHSFLAGTDNRETVQEVLVPGDFAFLYYDPDTGRAGCDEDPLHVAEVNEYTGRRIVSVEGWLQGLIDSQPGEAEEEVDLTALANAIGLARQQWANSREELLFQAEAIRGVIEEADDLSLSGTGQQVEHGDAVGEDIGDFLRRFAQWCAALEERDTSYSEALPTAVAAQHRGDFATASEEVAQWLVRSS